MKKETNAREVRNRQQAWLLVCLLLTLIPVSTAISSALVEVRMDPVNQMQIEAKRSCDYNNPTFFALEQICVTRRAEAVETLARMAVTPQPDR